MRQELHASLGFYNPTFFKMFVDTDLTSEDILKGNCSDNKKLQEASAAFFHEYIHYLQDISTSYGLMNITMVVDYIKYVNEKQINGTNRNFEIPAKTVVDTNDNTYLNLELRKYYIGDSFKENNMVSDVDVKKKQVDFDMKGDVKKVSYVTISYKNSDGCEREFRFGSVAICESMAYLMENYVYEDILPKPPYFPYNTATEVVEYLYPKINSHPLLVSALCEASLMFFNPGAFFYDTLIEMKKQSFEPSSYSEIFEFCYSRIKFNFEGTDNVEHLLYKMSSAAANQLGGYFTTPIFGDNIKWVSHTLGNALELRTKTISFITDIALMGKIQSNIFLQATLNKVGAPLFINNKGEVEFISPLNLTHAVRPGYLWAIQQVFDLYVGASNKKNSACELINWCNKSAKKAGQVEYTSSECYDAPWLKTTNKELCMFAQIWKTWGMQNEIPIPK
jgi:hypothetical protein